MTGVRLHFTFPQNFSGQNNTQPNFMQKDSIARNVIRSLEVRFPEVLSSHLETIISVKATPKSFLLTHSLSRPHRNLIY